MTIYSGFTPLKMVIFHGYVSLPEGTYHFYLFSDKAICRDPDMY